MAPRTVSSVVGQYQGTGALFTAVYARYDLLVLWYPSGGAFISGRPRHDLPTSTHARIMRRLSEERSLEAYSFE